MRSAVPCLRGGLLCVADLEALNPKSEVELVKKATCTSINLQDNKQYLVFGSRGSEVQNGRHFKWVCLCLSLTSGPGVCKAHVLCPSGIAWPWIRRHWWSSCRQTAALTCVRSTKPRWRILVFTLCWMNVSELQSRLMFVCEISFHKNVKIKIYNL